VKRLKNKDIKEFTLKVYSNREHFSDGKGGGMLGKSTFNYWIERYTYKTGAGGFNSMKELFDSVEKELGIERKSFKELIRRKLNKWLS
jgi:hypothetical protein